MPSCHSQPNSDTDHLEDREDRTIVPYEATEVCTTQRAAAKGNPKDDPFFIEDDFMMDFPTYMDVEEGQSCSTFNQKENSIESGKDLKD